MEERQSFTGPIQGPRPTDQRCVTYVTFSSWQAYHHRTRITRGLRGSMATIEYEGYVARIELDEDEKVLHGRVINISDVVTFEAAGAPQ